MPDAVAIPTDLGVNGSSIESVLKKFAAIALLPTMTVPTVPAHADPNDIVDPGASYSTFLQAIASDGIVMDSHQAIVEGVAVCTLMHPPNNGSLWDAGQHVKSMHPDWRIGSALSFSDRAVQDICPNRGSF